MIIFQQHFVPWRPSMQIVANTFFSRSLLPLISDYASHRSPLQLLPLPRTQHTAGRIPRKHFFFFVRSKFCFFGEDTLNCTVSHFDFLFDGNWYALAFSYGRPVVSRHEADAHGGGGVASLRRGGAAAPAQPPCSCLCRTRQWFF